MEQPNLNYILKLSGKSETFKHKIIDIIKYELPLEIDAYYMCLRLNKIKQVSECVHKIKHKISVYGMENSFYIAEEYENNLREGKTELQKEFEEILIVIRNFTNLQ
jgi:hypothetical protein